MNENLESEQAENTPGTTPEHEPVDAEQKAENVGLSELTQLGNEAIALGLIAGHGHRQGQYEIIRKEEFVTMPPQKAVTYLRDLVLSASQSSTSHSSASHS